MPRREISSSYAPKAMNRTETKSVAVLQQDVLALTCGALGGENGGINDFGLGR